jgi:type I restriction enzyme R subunit
MIGRATRKCDEIGKEVFRIYDAVDIYSKMQDHTDMKPVVNDPKITFEKLIDELCRVKSEKARQIARDQFIVKLRRKKPHMDEKKRRDFETKTGMNPDAFINHISSLSIKDVTNWFIRNPDLGELLDNKRGHVIFPIPVSDTPDKIVEVRAGYGDDANIRPEDYIQGFSKYIKENTNKIAALKLVLQRPKDLTRKQLRELQLSLKITVIGNRIFKLHTAQLKMPILQQG